MMPKPVMRKPGSMPNILMVFIAVKDTRPTR
jgi:hypothetical protein